MSKEISEYVNVPRSLYNRFPFGSAVGQPNNNNQHKQVLNKALDVLVEANEGGMVEESGIKFK